MPKRTNEFQKIVLRIYSALAGTGAKVEESVLLKEKNSDSEREVDVLVTTSVAEHQIRVAIESRDHQKDQDITWVDSLIGKYANLDVQKVIAVSHTQYSETAKQKADQHNIELLTLQEATETDWTKEVGPSVFLSFVFRNRPMFVGLQFNGKEQLKIEYTFEGELKSPSQENEIFAQFFLDVWEVYISHFAAQEISQYVFSNWDLISNSANVPRYCEIPRQFTEPRILNTPSGHSLVFNSIVWGVGTKYTAETLVPSTWAIGDKAAILTSALNDQGKPVNITLVTNQFGKLLGAHVDTE